MLSCIFNFDLLISFLEELLTELKQLEVSDAMTYEPLIGMVQVIDWNEFYPWIPFYLNPNLSQALNNYFQISLGNHRLDW